MTLPRTVRSGLDAVRRLEQLDLLSQFRRTRAFLFVRLLSDVGGKFRFEFVTKASQFSEVGIMRKGFSQPSLVVAKLGFCDGQVLPHPNAF